MPRESFYETARPYRAYGANSDFCLRGFEGRIDALAEQDGLRSGWRKHMESTVKRDNGFSSSLRRRRRRRRR